MGLSLPHLVVLALIVLLLFGRGKISELMGDFGKGIKSFKEGVSDPDGQPAAPPPPVQLTAHQQPAAPPPAAVSAQPAPAVAPPPVPVMQPTLNGEPVPEQHGQR